MGDRIPADHNYRLYSCLIGQLPQLKQHDWQLLTFSGIPDRQGWVKLGRGSTVGVRCDLSLLELFGGLDGQVLRVGQTLLQLGKLEGRTLSPAPTLEAALVTIKTNYRCRVGEFEFGVALGRQLQQSGIETMPNLGQRRALRIKDSIVVGYGLLFEGLKPQESLHLQRHGIGGRRKMGAGVFLGG